MRRALAATLFLAGLVACGGQPAGDTPGGADAVGRTGLPNSGLLPSVEVLTDAEILARLDGLKGTPVLINFWARWCTPCIAEMPTLVKVAADMKAAGGRVIAISMDLMAPTYNLQESREKTLPFLQERGFDLEVWLHTTGDGDSFVERFGLPGMGLPTTVAIDAAGRVVDHHAGELSRTGFDGMVRKALGDS